MNPSELLKEKDWCKGTCAKDRHGKTVYTDNESAVAFCALGAIYRCYTLEEQDKVINLFRYKLIEKYGFYRSIPEFNDNVLGSKKELIDLFKEVEKELEK